MRLALLPGLDGTGMLFDPLIACLADGPPPLIVRYPTTSAGSLSDHVDFAGNALSAGEEWLVLAESFSGPIAARLLIDRPDLRIRGVVFAASFLSPPRRRLMMLLKPLLSPLLLGMPTPDWLIKALCLGPEANRTTIALLRKALEVAGPSVLAARFRLLADIPPVESKISLPCLYIRPTADRLVSRSSMNEIAGLGPRMQIAEIAGPHFILQAEPDRCARVIEAFAATIAMAPVATDHL